MPIFRKFWAPTNKTREVYAVAARRKGNTLQLMRFGGNEKFFANEATLKNCGINLGDFCKFQVNGNTPSSFKKAESSSSLRFVVNANDENNVEGKHLFGKLVDQNGVQLFETIEFGNVAFLNNSPAQINKRYPIIVRLLDEFEQVGPYSNFSWGAEIDKYPEQPKLPDFQKLRIADEKAESGSDDENDFDDDDSMRTINGIVCSKIRMDKFSGDWYTVWTKESPRSGFLRKLNASKTLSIGDWVTLYFEKDEYEKYFPMQKSKVAEVERFLTDKYRKMSKPLHKTTVANGELKEVIIESFAVGPNYKQGDRIEDPFIGNIADPNKVLPPGAGKYELTIRFENQCEIWKLTVSKVTKTEKKDNVKTFAKQKSFQNENKNKFKKEKKENVAGPSKPQKQKYAANPKKNISTIELKNKKEDQNGAKEEEKLKKGQAQVAPNRPFALPQSGHQFYGYGMAPHPHLPIPMTGQHPAYQNFQYSPSAMPNMMFPPPHRLPRNKCHAEPTYAPPRMQPMPMDPFMGHHGLANPPRLGAAQFKHFARRNRDPSQPRKTPTNEETVEGKGFKKQDDKWERIKTRAMVTRVVKSEAYEDSVQYFLWMLDEHKSSVLKTTISAHKLDPGHFFEGFYKREINSEKWECVKYVNPLWKLMEGEVFGEAVQLKITVNQYTKSKSKGNIFGKTSHEYFGDIIDNQNKLPKDCSDGVRIIVRQVKIKGNFVWAVVKNLDSIETKLISAFSRAWDDPTVRDIVRRNDPRNFRKIEDHYRNRLSAD